MVGLIDVKWNGGASVGYWVNYLTFDLTHDLDLGFYQSQISKSLYLRNLIWLMWNEKKANQLDIGLTVWFCLWPYPWSWPWSFKVKVWNLLISGMRGLIDMEGKRSELIIHDHDHDLWVTMVGWVDVPDSDQGDFRRQGTVNISRFCRRQAIFWTKVG